MNSSLIRGLRYRFEQAANTFWRSATFAIRATPTGGTASKSIRGRWMTQVFPLALTPGADSKLELVGFQLPTEPTSSSSCDGDPRGPMTVGVPMGDQLSNPVPVFASSLPPVMEAAGDNNSPEKAQPITAPAGISGRIEAPSDIDFYVFEAKKGETISVEVVARRLQSSLDSIIRITTDKLGTFAESDDARIGRLTDSDSWIETWAAPG